MSSKLPCAEIKEKSFGFSRLRSLFISSNSRGFSLIELMVTIGIIAVVAAMGIASVNTLKARGRDTQRQADLRAIQSALQQYYANEQHYPDSLNLTGGAALTNCTAMPLGVNGCPTVSRTYMQRTPVDPIPGTSDPYCYTSRQSVTDTDSCASGNSRTCHYYELCARLESSGDPGGVCSCDPQNNFEVNPL